MRIGILSRNERLYSTRALIDAATERGHSVQVIDYERVHLVISPNSPTIYLGETELNQFDAVIPRIGAKHSFFGTAVVRQFEMMGVYCLNESTAITRSRDKLRSLQLLSRAEGVSVPGTAFANNPEASDHLLKACGGVPLVIKLLEGTQGMGVVLAENETAASSVIEAFAGLQADILVQEFVKEAEGSDLRCFVVGERVVASIKRIAKKGDFRSNLHRGGSAEKVKITPKERAMAVKAAKTMGLNVAGVDLLRGANGPMVLEVNSSPGIEGITKATDINVAELIIEFIEEDVLAPRPRGTWRKG